MHVQSILALVVAVAMPAAAADFDWDCTNSLGTCNNACYAVNNRGVTGLLTYDADASARDPRRTASGCNRTPCSNTGYQQYGNSCDEFPFASVEEGGAGAILRCVDGSENSSEGGQLGNFYKTINDGDTFDIYVKNYGGATFCINVGTANDGSEFELVNGAFQNAKVRRDMGFADAAPRGGPRKMRKFVGDDGVERLLLSGGSNRTYVGAKIFDGERYTTIVDEVAV